MKNYTESERKIICSVLKKVKPFVKTSEDLQKPTIGKTRAICFALDCVPNLPKKKNRLVSNLIADRLRPASFVEGWLERKVPSYRERYEARDPQLAAETQDYRHRWLDALIKEFSE